MLRKKIYLNWRTLRSEMLPSILEDFYTNARQTNGKKYHVSTMKSMRSSINCWFQESRNINDITDKSFVQSNVLFKGVQVEGKREGRVQRNDTNAISAAELLQINQYFTIDHMNYPIPKILQRQVMFNLM